jgi:hypothetical protein
MSLISPLSLVRNPKVEAERAPSSQDAREAVRAASDAVVRCAESYAKNDADVAFRDVECQLRDLVFAFARAVVVLFLVLRESRTMQHYPAAQRVALAGRSFLRAPAIARNLTTMFGVVRYWRSYMREVGTTEPHGFHPLDCSLGLPADRFSWNVLARAAWLATKLSFAEARSTLAEFIPNTPSTEVIEKTVLGFGHFAETWLESRAAPEDDGEVLIIMFDGKGIPTATDEELRRRRGKRRRRCPEPSPRHRGRNKRTRQPKKPRRKKGDKSKNAKVATTVVMYTLRRQGTRRLEGPVNKWIYSSFAPKRHAFEMARRWADKRGFADGTGKLVQIVTDGDNDLAKLSAEYFPKAEHTIDVWHVVEYLWKAGECLYEEGSKRLKAWVAKQKDRLFDGDVVAILRAMKRRLDLIPKTGPGNKGRRARLATAIGYIERRADKMDYGSLRRRDLEISSGPIEGAIKHVIRRRQDHGGMRWIKERAEAVLKLRCIEVTGAWDEFERDVHDLFWFASRDTGERFALQADEPAPLPHLEEEAAA